LAVEYLFTPLGIEDIYWEADTEGHSFGGNGLFIRPRDLAKIGQMVFQRGIWNGRQIVSEEWLVQATSSQVQPPEDDHDFINRGYGFYWWLYYEWDAVGTSGHGRNDLIVFPKEDMVIVHTGTPGADVGSEAFITMDRLRRIINEILKSIADTTGSDL
jgi:CubicO group peptidase (beta-lactamase class C family)